MLETLHSLESSGKETGLQENHQTWLRIYFKSFNTMAWGIPLFFKKEDLINLIDSSWWRPYIWAVESTDWKHFRKLSQQTVESIFLENRRYEMCFVDVFGQAVKVKKSRLPAGGYDSRKF